MIDFISQSQFKSRQIFLPAVLLAHQAVLLPLYFFVPAWIALLNTLVVVMVYWAFYRQLVIHRWIKLAITLVAIGGVYAVFQKFTGKEAGIALITAMYGLKILEVKNIKDANLVLSFGFFMLVTGFLFSQSLAIAVYQFVPVVLLLYAFVAVHSIQRYPIFGRQFSRLLKRLAGYLLLAIPIMLVLFVFFPRLGGPIWRMPGESSASSGISDSMSPGEISGLQLSDEVAFRVVFNGKLPAEADLYWRVLTLDKFDGISWTARPPVNISANPDSLSQTDLVEYAITLEPTQQDYLVLLDRPVILPDKGQLKSDYSVRSDFHLIDRVRFTASSYPKLIIEPELTDSQKAFYTQLPGSGNPRAKTWALNQRNRLDSDWAFINQVLQHINQQPFHYTLTPPIMSEDTVDSFWFDNQRGFCEHYSGALVFLARSAGIPARVVVGYQGAEQNTLTDYWIVRNSNAHAWVEIWLKEQGWIRVDPTGAIDPSRVEPQLLNDYRQRERLFGDFEVVELGAVDWIKSMEYWVDQVNANWNDWILDYNESKQQQLFSHLGLEGMTNQQLMTLMVLVVLGLASMAGFQILRKRRSSLPLARQFDLLQQKLAKQKVIGYDPSLGPAELKAKLGRIRKYHFRHVIDLLDEYIALQYAASSADEQQVKQLVKRFKQLKL
ncbi:transglutaminaseTgpA domain-containing protein [Aliikangiella maris]|uniref:DUF3488 and transglutaminase-like domain-containing protein n=2 Tax=Aliikangiella maris TaxID=3162458 RepID=A0ABV3MJY3_9GAMM